jgi:hypothetical protein
MTIPQTYRKSKERVIQSYDFIDMINNLGYVNFYFSNCIDEETENIKPFLTNYKIEAQEDYIKSVSSNSTEWILIEKKDIDIQLQSIQTIEGLFLIYLAAFTEGGFSSYTASGYVNVEIKKVVGETEESLGKAQSSVMATSGAVDTILETLGIDISETKFRKGDKLRVSLNFYGKVAIDLRNVRVGIYVDPKEKITLNATETYSGDKRNSRIIVPFKLNINT